MTALQHTLHQSILTDCDPFFIVLTDLPLIKTDESLSQIASKKSEQLFTDCLHFLRLCLLPFRNPRQQLIDLIDKKKSRNLIMLQKLPQNSHLRIRTLLRRKICGTDHQHRRIQNAQHALHLRRKIHVARRIQNGKRTITDPKPCKLRINRDPPLLLHFIRIQKRVAMIHASPLFHCPRLKQDALR